jgi:hypothetical protein
MCFTNTHFFFSFWAVLLCIQCLFKITVLPVLAWNSWVSYPNYPSPEVGDKLYQVHISFSWFILMFSWLAGFIMHATLLIFIFN